MPFGKHADQSQSSTTWNATCKQHAGKIVFSKEPIEPAVSSDAKFASTFTPQDQIFGRAFWPRALRNYALAVDKKDGKPLYGPEFLYSGSQHTVELLLFVTVDGKPVHRTDQLAGEFSWFRVQLPSAPGSGQQYRPGSETDFYAYTQTCRLHVSLNEIETPSDEWMNVANRFRRLFKSLCNSSSPSIHTVQVDLCFRIEPNENFMRKKPSETKFPLHRTPVSAPIATGQFTLNCPADPSSVALAPMFPPRSPNCTLPRAVALDYEQKIRQWLTDAHGWGKGAKAIERTIVVVLDSDWYVCNTDHFEVSVSASHHSVKVKYVKEPVQYGLECRAYFYRSPDDNWGKEQIACFSLCAMGARSRNPEALPPFTGVAVGGNYTFDADLLPDEVLSQLKRCRPELRDGLFDMDKLPYLNFVPIFSSAPNGSNTSSSSSGPSSSQ